MSSPEEDAGAPKGADSQPGPSKRRKVAQRACDYCRRKKIKCDGPQMPNKRCTKCISRRAECTYVEPFHKSRYTDSYVENLEQRLRRMEALLDKLNAGAEAKKVIESDVLDIETPQTVDSQTQPTTSPEASTSTSAGISPLAMAPPTPPAPETPDEEDLSDDDVAVQRDIIQGINKLSLNPSTLRYHGKSSGWVFIQTTAGLRQEYIREPTPPSSNDMTPLPQGRRLVLIDPKISYQYEPQPWLERPFLDPLLSLQDFPPHDLLWELLELYFRHINDTTPLLHKPTFMQSIREGLHLRHGGFGATVLLACALGSRYSHDPRVLLDGTDSWRSAGWKWYQKVEDMHKSPLAPVQLYDVQICALMTMYIQGTTSPQTTWVLIGIGIRKALDVGAHRKSMYKTQPTIEDELWRRAFWTLMFLEIWSSYGLGRPPCIHEEEYDVALPTECDDEYWVNDDPRLAFKQPPGKPSTVSFYVTCLRLSKIVAYALRTIFSIRKTRTQLGNGDQQWEERIVAQLDSELNKWLDSIPEHLKWDPNREEEVFLRQSATLHASYYTAQIAVHRSFITSRRQSSHALASLIICTNAARSCVKVLYQLCQRTGTPLARNAGLLFSSGLVLLMSMWGQRRSGRYSSANRDQEYVQQCIDMLKIVEREYHVAERLRDMLRSFLSLDTPTVEPHTATQSSDAFQAQKGSTTSAGPAEAGGEPSHASGGTGAVEFRNAEMRTSCGVHASTSDLLPSPGLREPSSSITHAPGDPDGSRSSHVPHDPHINVDAISQLLGEPNSMDWLSQHGAQSQPPMMQELSSFTGRPQPSEQSFQQWDDSIYNIPGVSGEIAGPSGSSTIPEQMSLDGSAELAPPDYAFIDDTMSMWSTAPWSFGWDDWDAYFNAVNNHGGQ
ncbi:hypothetical protein PYCCODRAFT_1437689 [Trametes coccinea BRFM310]|uniref:Zn(2)-C6 fungal-type domain-containing protein n=1 Tax=Trametes coccinea (strain BRFM310) TaxID=1353009 RepID=A0A1Y2IHY1_TRAC3|nr:hypothetical protein PYCCODRAFT_1437689 [Trametes coccinea BRFM310]